MTKEFFLQLIAHMPDDAVMIMSDGFPVVSVTTVDNVIIVSDDWNEEQDTD